MKLNLTSSVNVFTFPTIQLSFEKKIRKYVSLSTEAGYQLYDIFKGDTTYLESKGYKINGEFRFYFNKFFKPSDQTSLIGPYIALQPFFRKNQKTESLEYYISPDSIIYYIDVYGVKKSAFGVNLILGHQHVIFKKIMFDWHVGLGVINRHVLNTNREFDKNEDHLYAAVDLQRHVFIDHQLSESSGISGNVILGLRMGYKF